jgi:cobalt transporter subunit CbtB
MRREGGYLRLNREPGDLPAITETPSQKARPADHLSSTEVVMLAQNTVSTASLTLGQRMTTAIFAAAFGVFLVYFTAFSHSEVLHNAAHDTRHAITAPCH